MTNKKIFKKTFSFNFKKGKNNLFFGFAKGLNVIIYFMEV